MIAIILRDMRWRLVLLLALCGLLYALEPGFHQHEGQDVEAIALGPLGISATLAYLSGLAMIILLSGFISGDRREGYTRLFFSQPTSPLQYYGVRWGVAYLVSVGTSVLFLVLGQAIAWGEVRGGWSGLILPMLTALIYGGLIAFLSAVLPRGDAWVGFLLFLPTFFPQILQGLANASPFVRQVVLLIIPPQGALQQLWEGLVLSRFSYDGLVYAMAYGLVFLAAAVLLLKVQDLP